MNRDECFERFIRYVLYLRKQDKYTTFVRKNFKTFGDALHNKLYFKRFIFRKKINEDILVGAMQKQPLMLIRAIKVLPLIVFIFRWFTNRLNLIRNSKIIAVLGSDGSGKSTIVETLNDSGIVYSMYGGDKEYYFQPLYNRLLSRGIFWKYFVFLAYYFENLWRYLKAVRLRISGYVVVFDRYPGFNIVKSDSFTYKLYRFLYLIFPKPSIYALVETYPQQAKLRRPGLSTDKMKSYNSMVHNILGEKLIVIENNNSVDSACTKLLECIYQKN